MRTSNGVLVVLLVACAACNWSPDDDDDGGGAGGASGEGGSGAVGGTAGSSGIGGEGGSAGSAGSAGAGGSAGVGGSAGAGGSAGSAGAGGSAGNAGTGGGGACDPACGEGRECCADHCVNPVNDPQHCGKCDVVCPSGTICSEGQCVMPPCSASCGSGEQCCGSACCGSGQLCCEPQGPLDMEPVCTLPDEHGSCPPGCAPQCICADPETPIATPTGERPIAALRPGDLVYSVHRGVLVAVPLLQTHSTPVRDHHVQRVTLASGRVLQISAGHPTADGRTFADLAQGAALDGVEITGVERIAYAHDATYDILPDSDTGAYFAAGVLIGSTLAAGAEPVTAPTAPFEAPQP